MSRLNEVSENFACLAEDLGDDELSKRRQASIIDLFDRIDTVSYSIGEWAEKNDALLLL